MKRYPKGVRAATPFVKEGPLAGVLLDTKLLGKYMLRAYQRYLRWVRYRVPGRFGIVSPFARVRNNRLAGCRDRLDAALVPFRDTRSTSHAALGLLLDDPESRAFLIEHVRELMREVDFATGEYHRAFAWLETLRPTFYAADTSTQNRLSAVLLPFETNQLLKELKPLHDEACADLSTLKAIRPDIFQYF